MQAFFLISITVMFLSPRLRLEIVLREQEIHDKHDAHEEDQYYRDFSVFAEYKRCPYMVNACSLTALDTYYYVGRAPVCSKDAVPPLGVH